MVTGWPCTTCPAELVVCGVKAVVSFWSSTICRLPENMLLMKARCFSLLVGVVLLLPLPPHAAITMIPAIAGRSHAVGKRRALYDTQSVLMRRCSFAAL